MSESGWQDEVEWGGGASTAVLDDPEEEHRDFGDVPGGGGPDDGGGGGGGGGGGDGGGDSGDGEGASERARGSNARFAVWLGLGSLALFFTSMAMVYAGLRWGSDRMPRTGTWTEILYANTGVLLLASGIHQWALTMIRRDRPAALAQGLVLAAILGVLFLAGQVAAWLDLRAHGFFLAGDLQTSFFYLLTGAHALHVVAGVLLLAAVAARAAAGRYTVRDHQGVELSCLYWHFLGVVWVTIFILLSI